MAKARSVEERMDEVLKLARAEAKRSKSWAALSDYLFGFGGPLAQLISDPHDRLAASQLPQWQEMVALIGTLPDPDVMPTGTMGTAAKSIEEYSGEFRLRIPKSLHAALVAEAEQEGVSLNQLAVAKLALQLRAAVAAA